MRLRLVLQSLHINTALYIERDPGVLYLTLIQRLSNIIPALQKSLHSKNITLVLFISDTTLVRRISQFRAV